MSKSQTEIGLLCDHCKRKPKWLIGNVKFGLWLCEKCDDHVEETGELPKLKTNKK